jgi:Iron-containing redox enzyme
VNNIHTAIEVGRSESTGRSERLRKTLSLTRGRLTELVREVWYHPQLGELYPEFLFAMHGVMMSSAPGMRMAADRCEELTGDPLRGPLRDYYREHAEEEQGHEEWLLADLASLGIRRDRVLRRLPYPSVVALVGSQYYWVRHVHPAAYLGYLAVLEQPAETEFLKDVHERAGIPLTSMSCHLNHAELDPAHVAEFDAALDHFALTRAQEELVFVSAITTIGHLERVFAEIAEHFGRIENPAFRDTVFTASEPVAAVGALR